MDTRALAVEASSTNLPVLGTVREAYASLGLQWRTLALIGAPLILFDAVAHEIIVPFGHSAIDSPSKAFAWLLVDAVSTYFDVVLAVTWLRAVVLRPPRPEVLFGEFEGLWRFFRYGILYAIVVWGPSLVVAINLRTAPDEQSMRAIDSMFAHPLFTLGATAAVFCTSTLIIARVGLVFPATALDRAITLRIAWSKSAGIFWRFMAIVVMIDLPFELVGAGLDFLKIGAGDVAFTALSLLSNVVGSVGFLILLAGVSLVHAWRHNLRSDTTQS
jgi:hypothetical protein